MDLLSRPEHRPSALLIYAVSTLTLLGASGVSPILPVLMADLALTEPQTGLIMSAYTVPVIAVVPVVGWLADRIGRRPPLVAGLLIFGSAGSLIFFTTDITTILALRFVQGVGYSAIAPLTITLLGDLFDGDAEAGAQGLRVVSVNLGGVVFPVTTGALAAIAWNVPFLLFALAIPAGLLVLKLLPDVQGTEETESERTRGDLRSIGRSVKRPIISGTLALGFIRFFMTYGVFTFLPILITSHDIGIGIVGLVIGTISGVKVLVASQSRRLFNLGPVGVVMAGALVGSGLAIAGFVTASTLVSFFVLAGLYGLAEGVIAPLQKSALTQNTDLDVRASIVSINEVLKNLGKSAAPIVVGVVISQRGLSDGFLVLGVSGAAVSALVMLAFAREYARRPAWS